MIICLSFLLFNCNPIFLKYCQIHLLFYTHTHTQFIYLFTLALVDWCSPSQWLWHKHRATFSAGKSGKRARSLTIASWPIRVGKVREKNYNHINTIKDSNDNYQYYLRADYEAGFVLDISKNIWFSSNPWGRYYYHPLKKVRKLRQTQLGNWWEEI